MLAVVLSSGSARGLAHIGVLKFLDENGIRPDIVVGSSMGALIGGSYASGMNVDEIESIAKNTDYKKMFSLVDISMKNGIIKGKKIEEFISKNLKIKKIEEFPIKFACVSTDLFKGKKIIFTKGDASKAIRASISIPGIFIPVKYKNSYLIDGGVSDPLPIDVAKNLGADKIIAVDVNAKMKLSRKIGLVESVISSLEIMQMNLSRTEENRNTIILKPNVKNTGRFEFSNAKKIIHTGYREAKKRENDIISLTN